jgi:DNA-binding GntR family transcriptional regulator
MAGMAAGRRPARANGASRRAGAEPALGLGELAGAAAIRERRTAQEQVADFLRDAILSGRLHGGARLVQDQIAAELSVSRVPVREALLQLEAEGLVRMQAHRGASVVWLSPEEIAELFEIRGLLVGEAVRRAVPLLTDAQLARLEQIERRGAETTGMAARVRLTHAFYAALFEHLDRPRLRAMIDKLEREVERYLQPLERPRFGHTAIVEACRRRDGEAAAVLVRDHLKHVGDRAVERLRARQAEGSTRGRGRR